MAHCFLMRSSMVTMAALISLACATGVRAQESGESPLDTFEWVEGPGDAEIGRQAELALPSGFRFTGAQGTQTILQMMQNPTSGTELGIIFPESEDANWFVVFEFDDIGYVNDDEKDDLDADAMLVAIKEGNEHGNRARAERGWPPLEIIGWERPPHYDEQTNNLEWAIRAASEGGASVNYNTRLLGRQGVMEVSLVCDPNELDAALTPFRELMENYSFVEGKRYAEFKSGDKIATYGLAALVTGGVAAVALKSGLLQKFWKLIVVGVVGIGAVIKRIFSRE
jgi:uncharacterized membrane-anchored protein